MKKNNNSYETIQAIPFPTQDKRLHWFTQTIAVGVHHFYIDKPILQFDEFVDLVNILKTAEPHDTIFIYIGTPGGDLAIALRIVNAIKMCNGTVITVLDGQVASAGTLIFLAGHKKMVFPHCGFMVHTVSLGTEGTLHNTSAYLKFSESWWLGICNEYYKGFLTDDELQRVIKNEELWLSSTDVMDRLQPDELLLNEAPIKNLENKIPELIEEFIKSAETSGEIQALPTSTKPAPIAKPKPKKKQK